MELSAIQSEGQNVPVANSELPLDMSVRKSVVADNSTDNMNEERNGGASNLVLDSTTQSALDISQPDTVPPPTVHYANDEQQNGFNVNNMDNNMMEVSPNNCNNVNIQVDNSVLAHEDMEIDQSSENVQPQKEANPDTTNTDSRIHISECDADSNMALQQGAETITNITTMDANTGNMDTGTHISTCENVENTEPSADITLEKSQETTTDVNNIIADTRNIDSGIDLSTSDILQSTECLVVMPVQNASQDMTDGDNNICEPQNNDLPQI